MKPATCLLLFLTCLKSIAQTEDLYTVVRGEISFTSDAPLELIEATSSSLLGLINVEKNTFAFKLPVASFEGFNSSLQREHFNENYLETSDFPGAKFYGNIIGDYSMTEMGKYDVLAQGHLDIHGVAQERALSATIEVTSDGDIFVTSDFTILLEDHKIHVPKIVRFKISEVIHVRVESLFVKRK